MLFPWWLKLTALYAIPTFEVFVACSWCFGTGRRWVLWAAIVTLAGFAGAFAAHAITVGPPNCQCFGPWLQYRFMQESATVTVFRNSALIAPLVVTLVLRRNHGIRQAVASDGAEADPYV